MERPQQQEIARSERGDVVQEAREQRAGDVPSEEGATGPVPEENRAGHRPERDQDKPEELGGAGRGRGPKKRRKR